MLKCMPNDDHRTYSLSERSSRRQRQEGPEVALALSVMLDAGDELLEDICCSPVILETGKEGMDLASLVES